jgi:NAD(P)-dependent dehydrogenase (short-subunit alcohol dehydrogenase family)
VGKDLKHAASRAGKLGEKLLGGTPLGRFGEPEDIGPVAVFLACDDAHWSRANH